MFWGKDETTVKKRCNSVSKKGRKRREGGPFPANLVGGLLEQEGVELGDGGVLQGGVCSNQGVVDGFEDGGDLGVRGDELCGRRGDGVLVVAALEQLARDGNHVAVRNGSRSDLGSHTMVPAVDACVRALSVPDEQQECGGEAGENGKIARDDFCKGALTTTGNFVTTFQGENSI